MINNAYEGVAGSPGWTSEGHFMEGQRTTEKEMEALLDRPGTDCFKCCSADAALLGFVSLEKQEGFVYLGLLTVSPHAQAAGIGRQLLAFGESYALSNHLPSIHITVINIRAELIAWYERRGYRATGKTIPFPSADRPKLPIHLIEMVKELKE